MKLRKSAALLARSIPEKPAVRSILKFAGSNSLSLALFALFLVCFGGAVWSGWVQQNADLAAHRHGGIGFRTYLGSGSFMNGLAVTGRRPSCN